MLKNIKRMVGLFVALTVSATMLAVSPAGAAMPSTSNVVRVTANGSLEHGDTGARVRTLQQALNRHGYGLVVDGHFGDGTYSALVDFQRRQGLVADGLAGKHTMRALEEAPATSSRPENPRQADLAQTVGSSSTRSTPENPRQADLAQSVTSGATAGGAPATNGNVCVGDSCAGEDPVAMGCNDGITVYETDYKGGFWEARYSPSCNAYWLRVDAPESIGGRGYIVGYSCEAAQGSCRNDMTSRRLPAGRGWTTMISGSSNEMVRVCHAETTVHYAGPYDECGGRASASLINRSVTADEPAHNSSGVSVRQRFGSISNAEFPKRFAKGWGEAINTGPVEVILGRTNTSRNGSTTTEVSITNRRSYGMRVSVEGLKGCGTDSTVAPAMFRAWLSLNDKEEQVEIGFAAQVSNKQQFGYYFMYLPAGESLSVEIFDTDARPCNILKVTGHPEDSNPEADFYIDAAFFVAGNSKWIRDAGGTTAHIAQCAWTASQATNEAEIMISCIDGAVSQLFDSILSGYRLGEQIGMAARLRADRDAGESIVDNTFLVSFNDFPIRTAGSGSD